MSLKPHLCWWMGSRLLLMLVCVLQAQAFDGYEVASRHPIYPHPDERLFLGNGRIGCSFTTAASPGDPYLKFRLFGDQWFLHSLIEPINPQPAEKVQLATITIEIHPGNQDMDHLPPLRAGVCLHNENNFLQKEWQLGNLTLMAGMTVSPASDHLLVWGEQFPSCEMLTTIEIPERVFHTRANQHVRTPDVTGTTIVGITHSLPGDESYGIGLVIPSNEVETSTTGQTLTTRHSIHGNWDLKIVVSGHHEGESLVGNLINSMTQSGIIPLKDQLDHAIQWWKTYWNRSLIDLRGSDSPDALRLEQSWVWGLHALASHARGSFPPGDGGVNNQSTASLARHDLLWELYGGWVLSHHIKDIHCLNYPIDYPRIINQSNTEGPLIPIQCGPDGISAASTTMVNTASIPSDLALPADVETRFKTFSAIPLILHFLGLDESGQERIEACYPFLFRNANHAMKVLNATQEKGITIQDISHLLFSIEEAYRIAQKIRIDPKQCREWKTFLDNFSQTKGISLEQEIEPLIVNSLFQKDGPNPISTQSWLRGRDFSADGLLLGHDGTPSLYWTGSMVEQIVKMVVCSREGILFIFPEIPCESGWNLHAENLLIDDRFSLVSCNMSHGIPDNVVIHAFEKGTCCLHPPVVWNHIQVAGMGDVPSEIEVHEQKDSQDRTVYCFEVEEGVDYLIGPEW